ncbi:BspA family leucine-rich repeat surface protein [Spiroplasma endosymbiont of Andrena trimmerana]|uniref:BspA family leucine-rich repeat surface protein n=1 Tax=Spiroplasma endosymbiont of Andrena trimmerana TaxID=3066316 RepID=UPI0030D4936A
MKTLLTAVSLLTFATTTGNLASFLNSTIQKNNITTNYIQNKTQQDTIYIDKDGKQITTSEKDLSKINSKEIIQIGFYKNILGEIQVVRMPRTIEKVPDKLPPEITSLKNMFTGATSFNQDLSTWDTSNITNMNFTFNGATSLNSNITNWNVSNVKSTFVMFANATSFNQDLSTWNVSNINRFSLMFYGATSFNQNISNWITSNAVYMNFMFYGAKKFNQDLSKWNVNKVREHSNFANYSGITNPNKLPKFKNNIITIY